MEELIKLCIEHNVIVQIGFDKEYGSIILDMRTWEEPRYAIKQLIDSDLFYFGTETIMAHLHHMVECIEKVRKRKCLKN